MVCISRASYAWCPGQPALLRDLNLQVAHGRLVIVIGSVGQGKSSLLAALLGEMCKTQGEAHVLGSIGYTCQVSTTYGSEGLR